MSTIAYVLGIYLGIAALSGFVGMIYFMGVILFWSFIISVVYGYLTGGFKNGKRKSIINKLKNH